MLRHVISICCCTLFSALIFTPLVARADTTVPYSGCGNLVPGVECPRFVGNDGVTFSITNTGKFQLGDYVSVQGTICFDCPSICQEGAVFQTESISNCVGIPPTGFLFNECGTLKFTVIGPGPSCLVFATDSGGLYQIENFGGFGPDDVVRVTSNNVSTPCNTFCGEFDACLEDNGIQPCIDPPLMVDACGSLVFVQGQVPCVVFQDDVGNRWLLDDMGSFQVGDRLHVVGPASPCQPFCSNTLGCIANNPPVGCLGDIDNSGEVNVIDLLAVIDTWGACNDGCPEDLNNDDQVNVQDLLIVIGEWS